MRVSVYQIQHGEDVKVGELRFDGRTVTASTDSPTLRFILRWPCRGPKGERLTAQGQPREFLANLHRQYRGVAMRCGPVEGACAAPPQDEDGSGARDSKTPSSTSSPRGTLVRITGQETDKELDALANELHEWFLAEGSPHPPSPPPATS